MREVGGHEHRETRFAELAVVPRVERGIQVDEVIGVLVRDNDRVQVGDVDVLLQVRQGPGARIHPQVEPVVLDEVARGGRVGVRPGTAGAEDGQLHETPSTTRTSTGVTPASSGPRKRWATRRNCVGSPVVRNSCRGSFRPSRSREDTRSVE